MKRLSVLLTLLLFGAVSAWAQVPKEDRKQQRKARQEESVSYFEKWLKEDVVYIITEEEREVFEKLSTDDERDQFIEQFWRRRDRDPRTSINEYKEEHYRRIAYVNEKFGSGIPGWKTDRGRTYIAFGPPDIIEDHPSGGWYYRPRHEGGGATSTYPFQLWIYNYIEGVGDQIEVEFVDPSWSGEYRMALEPWEKDALLHVGFMGPTDMELEGRLSKKDRPYFNPGSARNTRMQAMLGMRAQDKPFSRLARFYQLQQPEPIKYDDLKQVVTANISFTQLPFGAGYEYIHIDERQVLVPITVEVENQELSFSPTQGDSYTGQLNIYGNVKDLTGRFITEFEDTLSLVFPSSELDGRLGRKSVYQKMLLLPPGRYKLTLAVKDDRSNKVGTRIMGMILPVVRETGLSGSSVILARALQYVEDVPDQLVPFLLGDFKVIPNVDRRFNHGDDMGLYLQLYNTSIDQATLQSSLDVEYQIWREGKIVKSYLDPKKNSVLDYGDRIVLLQAFDLADLQPGGYTLKVRVRDQIQNQELTRQIDFRVTS